MERLCVNKYGGVKRGRKERCGIREREKVPEGTENEF